MDNDMVQELSDLINKEWEGSKLENSIIEGFQSILADLSVISASVAAKSLLIGSCAQVVCPDICYPKGLGLFGQGVITKPVDVIGGKCRWDDPNTPLDEFFGNMRHSNVIVVTNTLLDGYQKLISEKEFECNDLEFLMKPKEEFIYEPQINHIWDEQFNHPLMRDNIRIKTKNKPYPSVSNKVRRGYMNL